MNPKSNRPIVMVVDDSLDSIHMLNDLLEEEGFTVLVALEGTQALTISENIRPDIILLDALMPNMNGFDTCRHLKRKAQLADTPIIFMTGLSDTEHVLMGLNAGGVDYVTKPIRGEELIARMRVHLTNARINQQARAALDSAGQYLLTLDASGKLLWATTQVYQLLGLKDALDGELPLRAGCQMQIAQWLARKPDSGHQLTLECEAFGLQMELLNLIAQREYLLRLKQVQQPDAAADSLRQDFAVTQREADVLLWIAKGKTNREIGLILEMSPRTVNKHLEQIFKKLGVENRTSAAALAIKSLSRI